MLGVLSVIAAAAPIAFGLVRYFQSGSDLRMLWMACAALAGALVVRVVTGGRARLLTAVVAISAVVATLCAGLAALLLGATAGPGVWAVAIVFGLCLGASHAFAALSRRTSTARR